MAFWETPGVPSDHGVSVCLIFFVSVTRPDFCVSGTLANLLNTMEVDGRVKGKVVVDNKLGLVSSRDLWSQ